MCPQPHQTVTVGASIRNLGAALSGWSTVEAALRTETRMLWVETPTNPTMKLTDLGAAARISRRHRLRMVVDNTFMSPWFQQPISHGADLVVHSTTKYLNGHSDSIGGAVVTARERDAEAVAWYQKSGGAILGPHDCYLVLRGLKTLHVRMERHCSNASGLAAWLVKGLGPAIEAFHNRIYRSELAKAVARTTRR